MFSISFRKFCDEKKKSTWLTDHQNVISLLSCHHYVNSSCWFLFQSSYRDMILNQSAYTFSNIFYWRDFLRYLLSHFNCDKTNHMVQLHIMDLSHRFWETNGVSLGFTILCTGWWLVSEKSIKNSPSILQTKCKIFFHGTSAAIPSSRKINMTLCRFFLNSWKHTVSKKTTMAVSW